MADRLGAQPGSKAWGRLSVMVQVFAEVDGLFDVPFQFHPAAKSGFGGCADHATSTGGFAGALGNFGPCS